MSKKKRERQQERPAVGTPTGNPENPVDVAAAGGEAALATPESVAPPQAIAPIVDRLRAGRCVLCAGNGLESTVGMPSYRQLLNQLLDSISDAPADALQQAREVVERRPLIAAGFLRRHLGDRFIGALREASQAPAELPDTIRRLGELPFRAVLTTSYSDLLTRAFTKEGKAPPVHTPHDAEEMRQNGRRRFVLKALGDPDRPETVIWTNQDLQRALSSDAYRGVIHDIYRHRSILFLGFRVDDIELLFGRLFAGAHTESVHYAVLPGLSPIEAEELESTFHIRAIDEADLDGLVKALREAIGDFVADAPPDDDDSEGWLGLLAQEPGRADALAKLNALEEKLRTSGRHEALMELHLGWIEVDPVPAERARRLREVARILETEIGDLGRAFTALLAAFKETPEADLTAELERLAQATGMWSDLAGEYAQLIPHLPSEKRPDHWVRLAHLYQDKLSHPQYALTSVDEALKIDSFHAAGQELKIELLRRAERWRELAVALAARAENDADPVRKLDLLMEEADLLESRLSDGPAAAQAYRAALAVEPGHPEVLAALEHLYRRHGEFEPLLGVLDELVARADAERALELRKEAAAIAAEKLNQRSSAIERYEALRADGAADLAMLKTLEHLYDAEGRTAEYLEVLAAQVQYVKEDKERIVLLRRLSAEWEEQPSGTARAAEYLERLLGIEPRHEEALRGLERLYAADKKWEALVDTYRRHAALPGVAQATLLGQVGQVFEDQINDPGRAIEAWSRVVELKPSQEEALAALGRLYQRTGASAKAVEIMDRHVEVTKDRPTQVNLLHEAGKLAAEKLGDTQAAEAHFARALSVDATHVPSMLALVELYRESGEFLRAAKLLLEAEPHTHNRLEKTRLLVEAGELHVAIEDPQTGIELYLRALSVDPEHVEAAGRVAELLWRAERFTELVPVLEMLTRKPGDREVLHQRWLRLGHTTRRLGQLDRATRAFAKAAEIDPNDFEAQRALGELCFTAEQWADAQTAWQAVLQHHREKLSSSELTDLFFRLGECDRKLDHLAESKIFYGQALEIDPTHRPTLLARISLIGDDPKQTLLAKRALLATASADEKVRLLTEIADVHATKLDDQAAAIRVYREALEISPEARLLLHRCVELLVEQKEWRQALELLEKLTVLEPLVPLRAKLRFARAMIHREQLGEEEVAARLFTEALELDPNETPSAAKLEEILEKSGQWKELQRFYRRRVKRFPEKIEEDSPERRAERLRLWNRIAEISLDKLNERKTAIAAIEVAITLDPSSRRHEQLAELYVQAGPDYVDKAIAEHQSLLEAQHDRLTSYRALRKLYGEAKQEEKATAVACALALLKKGDPEDAERVAQAKQRPLRSTKRMLDDAIWTSLAHPSENRSVVGLFAQLTPLLAVHNSRSHKDAQLVRKERIDSADPRRFMKGLGYVAGVLDTKYTFESYVKYEQREALSVTACIDKETPIPCLVFGAPLVGEKRPERELLFELTKKLAYLRPERYLRFVFPQPAQLGLVIDAAIALAIEVDTGKDPAGPIGRRAQELKRGLSPKTLEQVVFFGRKLKGTSGMDLAADWLAAADLTATRAALLLVGDLEQTARLVAAEPSTVSTLPATHRLKELIWFSVSEDCFSARYHLGLMP